MPRKPQDSNKNLQDIDYILQQAESGQLNLSLTDVLAMLKEQQQTIKQHKQNQEALESELKQKQQRQEVLESQCSLLIKKNQELKNQEAKYKDKIQSLDTQLKDFSDLLNQLSNAIANANIDAVESQLTSLLARTDAPFDEKDNEQIKQELVVIVRQHYVVLKKLQKEISNQITKKSNSEKNTGTSTKSNKEQADDNHPDETSDNGTAFTNMDALLSDKDKQIRDRLESEVDITKYMDGNTKLEDANNKLNIQSFFDGIEQQLQNNTDNTKSKDHSELVLGLLDSVMPFISYGSAHNNGDQAEISALKQLDAYEATAIAQLDKNQKIALPLPTTIEYVCPKCKQVHLFKKSRIKYFTSHIAPGSNILEPINILYPELELKSLDPNCDHSFQISLYRLNVGVVLLDRFGACSDDVLALTQKEYISEEALTIDAVSSIKKLRTGNDFDENQFYKGSPENIPVNLKVKQAKNVTTKYEPEQHRKELKQAKDSKERSDINRKFTNHKANEIRNNPDFATYAPAYTLIRDSNGQMVVAPWSISPEVNSSAPFFRSTKLSAGFLIVAASVMSLYSPKTTIHTLLDSACSNSLAFVSRQTLINNINGLGRVLDIVNNQSRKDILSEKGTVLIDETVGKVRSGPNKKTEIKYVWGMRTSFTDSIAECYLQAVGGRAKQDARNFLNNFEGFNRDTIKTDGYGVYTHLADEINLWNAIQGNDHKVTHSTCMTHARRFLHQYLESAGLLSVYNEQLLPKGTEFNQFAANLRQYAANNYIDDINIAILSCYYLMNALFAVDNTVVSKHTDRSTQEFKDELQEVRNQYSAYILVVLNAMMEFLAFNKNLVVLSKNGKQYTTNKDTHLSNDITKGVLYWMKSRNSLSCFIEDPNIELSTSLIEQAFRPFAIGRRNCMWFETEAGLASYVNIVNINQNCRLANVPVYDYLLWLMCSIRARVDEIISNPDKLAQINKIAKLETGRPFDFAKDAMTLPSRDFYDYLGKDENGKEIVKSTSVDMYSPKNPTSTWLNFIPTEGLTPKDYARLIKEKPTTP